jgi:hypothetical protein
MSRIQFVDADKPAPPIARPAVTPALVARVTQTLPVTLPAKKKIGRPKSDHAMTAAERQRRRRDRLALAKVDP